MQIKEFRRRVSFAHKRLARGVAAVELAFLIGPFLVLGLGAAEFGRAIYTYNVLIKAVRDGARHMSVAVKGSATSRDEALCLVKRGYFKTDYSALNVNTNQYNVSCPGEDLVSGLSDVGVVIEVCDAALCVNKEADYLSVATGSGTINLVSVTILGFKYKPMLSLVLPDAIAFNPMSSWMRGAS